MAGGRPSPENVLQNVLTYLCFKAKTLSQSKLMKLVYLADVYHTERFGSRLTDVPFKHWHYGPWSEEVDSEIERLCGMGIIKQEPYLTRSGLKAEVPKPNVKQTTVNLSESALKVMKDIIEDWGTASSDEVITHAKTSLPFVGTPFGEQIDFTRIDIVREFSQEKGISIEEAATALVENDAELMKSLERAKDKART